MAAYCTTADLLIGDIPTSGALDPAKYVADAADEIDSKIGFVYTTPIDTSSSATPRPVALLLKRLNSHLASGRLILAATIPAEDERLNAYGATLVTEVEATLYQIQTGAIVLDGVPKSGLEVPVSAHPVYSNADSESQVEAFYNRVINPDYRAPIYGPVRRW